jgi:hypothetical protein
LSKLFDLALAPPRPFSLKSIAIDFFVQNWHDTSLQQQVSQLPEELQELINASYLNELRGNNDITSNESKK